MLDTVAEPPGELERIEAQFRTGDNENREGPVMSPLNSSAPPMPSTVAIPLLSAVLNKEANATDIALQEKKSSWGDVAVASGIIALLLALLIPTLGKQEITLPNAKHSLVEHLRFTRAGAVNRGAHFRVTFQDHTYAIEQLQDTDGDGIWTPDAALPSWRINLPTTVTIEAGAAQSIEFDNRGSLAGDKNIQNGKLTIRIRDELNGRSETIQLLPSGQVEEA
jgi:Tfp pilus assembly protein FimT